ncbi:MAG: hypothetical protein HOP31_12490, partial [Ignavibacteria bacterium]|nr:hypothetical protein [Ignavibacteria bacterium]
MPNYEYITYDEFKEKILKGDYVFDKFIFSEYFYKNITTDEPDIIYFGQQIYDIIHVHDRKKLNDKLNFVFTNCKFGSMVHFDFEALPNVSILRFRNCDFDNNTIFKNLQIDTSEREKGKKFKFNYCFFDNVKFQTVDFENVEFKTSHIFNKTDFLDVTTFDNCIFKEDLFARNLRFTNDVIVIGTKLEKKCELRCTFERDLYIVSSRKNALNETTNEIEEEIKCTKFLGSTLFASEFKGGIIFNGADFNDTFIFRPNSLSQNNIYFENINFNSVAKLNNLILGENIYFNNVDLSFISLENSNFHNASF